MASYTAAQYEAQRRVQAAIVAANARLPGGDKLGTDISTNL